MFSEMAAVSGEAAVQTRFFVFFPNHVPRLPRAKREIAASQRHSRMVAQMTVVPVPVMTAVKKTIFSECSSHSEKARKRGMIPDWKLLRSLWPDCRYGSW